MARNLSAPPVAKFRELEAHESGSAIHRAIVRCHELERQLHRTQLALIRVLLARLGWLVLLGPGAFVAGVLLGAWLY